jgi:hypothetical protein
MTIALPRRLIALGLFAAWLSAAVFLILHYVVWRDDVRALTLALQGQNVFSMLKNIHGEGHPAIWYLLLRGAYSLVHRPQVLQIVSLITASVAVLLLLYRSPFRLPVISLILFGNVIFEYTVIPRNYGIVVLFIFTFVVIYEEHHDKDCWPGVVLLLLANCHLLSVMLVGFILLFWLIDILAYDAVKRPRALRFFLINAVIACLGIALCIMTVFPVYNDAAVVDRQGGITFKLLLQAALLPAVHFSTLILPGFYKLITEKLSVLSVLLSLVMFGSTLGLIRRIGAFIAALAALISLSIFFTVGSPGAYRHEGIWLVMLICMYWLAISKDLPSATVRASWLRQFIQPISLIGEVLFLVILLLQIPANVYHVIRTIHNGPPNSRSGDVGALVAKRPDFQRAIILADPDYLVEPLPYFVSNQTYLMREHRYGNVTHFTKGAQLQLCLGDILENAHKLHVETGRPILILLETRLDRYQGPQVVREGYRWDFITTPDQVRAFRASTHLIESFGPAVSDETYDLYELIY